jgi:hypothetical protein
MTVKAKAATAGRSLLRPVLSRRDAAVGSEIGSSLYSHLLHPLGHNGQGRPENMNNKLVVAILVAMLAITVGAFAQGTPPATPTPLTKQLSNVVVEASATVTAINMETREVTFKRSNGAIRTIVASPEVKNLAQVKVGDTIVLRYQQAASIKLEKRPTGAPSIQESSGVSRNAPGTKPGVYAGQETTISAEIDQIDALNSTVTLKGPRGGLVDVEVKDKSMLGKLNVGDLVVITYTEAVALSVEVPKK